MKCAAAIAVLVSALAATPLVSQQNPAAPPPANLVILGRVVEAGTTSGVAGALVVLTGGASLPGAVPSSASPSLSSPESGPRRVVADSQGQFVFRDLPAGVYTLTSTANGYIPGLYGQTRIVQIARGLDLVRPLELTGNDKLVNVSIQMWRTGGISGRLTDELGEPLVNVPITILARMTDWGGPTMVSVMTTPSDDRGMYHVDIVPGDYVVGVQAATTTIPASAVQGFLQTQALGGAEFQQYMQQVVARGSLLPRGYGSRIGDFVVSQFGSRNSPVVPPFRSDDGKQWFYPSTYHRSSFTAPGAQIVSVVSGEEKSGIDIVMRPSAASRVSGRLLGPNGPAPGIALRLLVPDPALNRTIPTTTMDTPQAMADDNGNFTFIGVAPGTYTLVSFSQTPNANASMLWAAESIAVGESDLTDLQIRLQTGSQISGRILFEGGPAPPEQTVRAIGLSPRPLPGTAGALSGFLGTDRVTDAAPGADIGFRFTTRAYAPGPYMMSVSGIPRDWVLKSVTSGGQDALDRAFQLGPSGVSDMVVTISNRISTVTGLARDAEGKAVASAAVAIFPTDKSLWRLPGMQSRRMVTAAPDRSGRFTFRGLPAGDYFVVAADWPSQDFSDANVLSALIQHAQRVSLTEGESRSLDLRVVVMK